MILQFVYVKIAIAITTFILALPPINLYHEGNFSPSYGYLYITIIYNISIFISLYFLVLFYEATKEILEPFQPLNKFLCIKAIIFFAFWQSVLISIMIKFNFLIHENAMFNTEQMSVLVQNSIICIEMVPIGIAFAYSFSWAPYVHGESTIVGEASGALPKAITNFLHVMNVSDVIQDTKSAIKKEPKRNIDAAIFLNMTQQEQLQHVVKHGSIKKCGEDLAKIVSALLVSANWQPVEIQVCDGDWSPPRHSLF